MRRRRSVDDGGGKQAHQVGHRSFMRAPTNDAQRVPKFRRRSRRRLYAIRRARLGFVATARRLLPHQVPSSDPSLRVATVCRQF
jgi:hypothetical protein